MSTAAGAPSNGSNAPVNSPPKDKGKGKSAVVSPDVSMEEDDEDDEEDEEEEYEATEGEDEEEEEDEDPEIDPSAIVGRRTRGIKVDYSSKEAHEKAGLDPQAADDEDDEMK
ncbi:hypothetical protein JVU11DRAFT_2381 [Chiua virens]|nr:hypothetical protein JVU11DRAFT_2381 [Chiua virens]